MPVPRGATDGVYQIDGHGWFAADGTLLLQEYYVSGDAD